MPMQRGDDKPEPGIEAGPAQVEADRPPAGAVAVEQIERPGRRDERESDADELVGQVEPGPVRVSPTC